jgi:hypothetical protein
MKNRFQNLPFKFQPTALQRGRAPGPPQAPVLRSEGFPAHLGRPALGGALHVESS